MCLEVLNLQYKDRNPHYITFMYNIKTMINVGSVHFTDMKMMDGSFVGSALFDNLTTV